MQMADKFLKDHGLLPYIIWVLEKNKPACSLYEKLGGKVKKERIDDRCGMAHRVIGYVFNWETIEYSCQKEEDKMIIVSICS